MNLFVGFVSSSPVRSLVEETCLWGFQPGKTEKFRKTQFSGGVYKVMFVFNVSPTT